MSLLFILWEMDGVLKMLYQGIASKESKQRMKRIHWCYLFDTTEMTFIMKSREVSIEREISEQTYRL